MLADASRHESPPFPLSICLASPLATNCPNISVSTDVGRGSVSGREDVYPSPNVMHIGPLPTSREKDQPYLTFGMVFGERRGALDYAPPAATSRQVELPKFFFREDSVMQQLGKETTMRGIHI